MDTPIPIETLEEHPPIYKLPREAYTSRDWFEDEKEKLFSRVWTFAGLTNQLRQAGDFICVQAGNHPLFVVRHHDGELHAFYNLCRHRGVAFLEGSGNARGGLRCPYHFWTYGLDGSLRGITNRDASYADIDTNEHGLMRASVSTFKNMVFVHPEAEPDVCLADFLGDLPDKAWPYSGDDLREGLRVRHVFRANWKLVLENALDTYHLPYLHKDTLGPIDPNTIGIEPIGKYHHSQIFHLRRELSDADWEGQFERIEGARLDQFRGTIYHLFPNFLPYPDVDKLMMARVSPIAADLTYFDVEVWIPPPCEKEEIEVLRNMFGIPGLPWTESSDDAPPTQTIALGDLERLGLDPMNLAGKAQLAAVTVEDQWLVERIQLAMRSSRFSVGPMAPIGETSISYFHQKLLDFMT